MRPDCERSSSPGNHRSSTHFPTGRDSNAGTLLTSSVVPTFDLASLSVALLPPFLSSLTAYSGTLLLEASLSHRLDGHQIADPV